METCYKFSYMSKAKLCYEEINNYQFCPDRQNIPLLNVLITICTQIQLCYKKQPNESFECSNILLYILYWENLFAKKLHLHVKANHTGTPLSTMYAKDLNCAGNEQFYTVQQSPHFHGRYFAKTTVDA